MGILDRIIGVLNKADDIKTDLEYGLFEDRRFGQAERLQQRGDPSEGLVTGYLRKSDGQTSSRVIRVDWFAPEQRCAAISIGTGNVDHIWVGCTVPLRTDGDRAVLDWEQLAPFWGGADPGQRRERKVPQMGVVDKGLVSSVQSRLKKWPAARGTVVSFEQSIAFGMPTQNYHLTVAGDDGSTRLVKRDEVPPYARWLVAPGASVPIVLDPDDATRAQINWPALAMEGAAVGGSWRDPHPPGSIAAVREADGQTAS